MSERMVVGVRSDEAGRDAIALAQVLVSAQLTFVIRPIGRLVELSTSQLLANDASSPQLVLPTAARAGA